MEHDRMDPDELSILSVEAWLSGRAAGSVYARENNPADSDFIYIESQDLRDATDEDMQHMNSEDKEMVQTAFIVGWFEAVDEVWKDEWDDSHG